MPSPDAAARSRAGRSRRRSLRYTMKNVARFSKVNAPKDLTAVKFIAPRNPAEQPVCQYCQGNCDGGCF